MISVPFVSTVWGGTARAVDPGTVSQIDNAPASNDCGPACVLMLARWMGADKGRGVADIANYLGRVGRVTGVADLTKALQWFGLTPRGGMGQPYPYIALVRYDRLPERYYPNLSVDAKGNPVLHWVLRLSDTTYHDPLYPGVRGANKTMTLAQFAAAEVSPSYRIGIAERPKETTTVTPTSATVKAVSWNVRRDKTTKAESLGVLVKGDTVTVAGVVQGEGGEWYSIPLSAGGVTIKQVADEKTPVVAYMRADGFVSATPPTNPTPAPTYPTSRPRAIGTHPALPVLPFHKLVGVHMLTSGKPQLQEYIDAGCRAFTCMDNVAAAREARAAGAASIFRRFINHGVVPEPTAFARGMGVDANDALILMGINEADSISTSEIEKRFAWDKAWALEAHRLYPKCFIVIGSFSMGTPQLENAEVAKRFRDTYTPFLNANADWCGVNYHGYSGRPTPDYPPATAPVIAPEWLEMRWLKYAYDPKFGALSKDVVLVNDESGVDVAGAGGFSACNYTEELFGRWWAFRKSLYEAWPQQYIFNLFQGDATSNSWRGYNVRGYLGKLRQIWSGADVRVPWLTGVADLAHYDTRGGSPLPANWEPTPKALAGVSE